MKIILQQDEKKLGKKGDLVEVSEGYARNYILPKKIGVEATPANMNDLKLKKANNEKIAREQLAAAKEQYGIDVDKKKLQLPEALKNLGSYEVSAKLHPQVTGKITVKVTTQEG